MLTREVPIDEILSYSFCTNTEKIVFFDIETTGFAADTSYLYLIGCIFFKNSSFHLIQWFAEDIKEEALLISSFFEFLKDFEVLVHFNGNGFDIPYLIRKCSQLQLEYTFDKINSIDIYRKILPYKKIFQLKSYKQKEIEAFLKVNRDDKYSGGELIEVYQSYLGKKRYELLYNKRNPNIANQIPSSADALLHMLLLHNEDDVKGLIKICPILSYTDLFETSHPINQAVVIGNVLTIQFELTYALPVNVYVKNSVAEFYTTKSLVTLNIPIFEGELKYYYENYKDYYYLPAEDKVIHKSLALFVDKDFREKAKPSNCYTRKKGLFVPQYDTILTQYFKNKYTDKITFIEIHTDFLLKEDNLSLYVSHILSCLLTSKI